MIFFSYVIQDSMKIPILQNTFFFDENISRAPKSSVLLRKNNLNWKWICWEQACVSKGLTIMQTVLLYNPQHIVKVNPFKAALTNFTHF